MWLVKTKKDGEIEAPHMSYANDGRVLHLQSTYRKKLSYEVKDWKWLWLKEKTITKHKDKLWTFYVLPLDQFISATWIEKKKESDT